LARRTTPSSGRAGAPRPATTTSSYFNGQRYAWLNYNFCIPDGTRPTPSTGVRATVASTSTSAASYTKNLDLKHAGRYCPVLAGGENGHSRRPPICWI